VDKPHQFEAPVLVSPVTSQFATAALFKHF